MIVKRQLKLELYSSGKFGDSIIPPSSVTFLHDPQSPKKKFNATIQIHTLSVIRSIECIPNYYIARIAE